MRQHVINGKQGNVPRPGKRLGKGKADNQGTQKPRTAGNGNRVNIPRPEGGFVQRLLYHRVNPFGVFTAGNFGNHPVIRRMKRNLRRYHIGKNPPAVFHHSGGALVAGRFNAQYFHVVSIAGEWGVGNGLP